MKSMRVGMLFGGIGALLFAGAAGAQGVVPKQKMSDAEVQIIAKLHHANQMEIELGKLAAERAKSPQVKAYAARLVKDHSKADGKVMDLAKKRGVTVAQPTPKNDAEKKEMDDETATTTRLKQLEGDAFDHEFTTAMVSDHVRALAMVSDGLTQAKDPDLVSLLKSVRPVLEQHQKMAQKLAEAGSKSGTDNKSNPTK